MIIINPFLGFPTSYLLTPGVHAQRGLQYFVCVSVRVCVCLLLNISLFTQLFVPQMILTFSAADEGRKF